MFVYVCGPFELLGGGIGWTVGGALAMAGQWGGGGGYGWTAAK